MGLTAWPRMVSHITIHDTNTCNYLLWRNLQLTHIYEIHWMSAKTDPLKAPLPPLANHCQVNLCTDAIEGAIQRNSCTMVAPSRPLLYHWPTIVWTTIFNIFHWRRWRANLSYVWPLFDAFGLDCKTLRLLSSALTTKPPHILPSSDKSAHLPKWTSSIKNLKQRSPAISSTASYSLKTNAPTQIPPSCPWILNVRL